MARISNTSTNSDKIKENAPSRPPSRVLFSYPPLPEIKLCYAVTIGAMIYAWIGVYRASINFPWKIGDYGGMVELPFIGPIMKDYSNWEWHRWSPFAQSYLPVFISHSFIFNIGSNYLPESIFSNVYTIYSILVCAWFFSPFLVAMSILQGAFIFICTQHIKQKMTVWISSLPILYITMHHASLLSDDPFLIYTFVSYSMLSYISYNLESLDGVHRKEDDTLWKRFFRMLFYAFYQPYLFSLIVLYPDFERQILERKNKIRDWKECIWSAAKISFWWIIVENMLCFFYFEAILKNGEYAFSLPKDQFVGLGMALGIFFHLKYTVIFGLPSLFAKIDNMDPLDGPICIIRVTLYSKVWREFDRGLYQFFKKYIFIPICAPSFSLGRKIFGVFVSYGFVLLWHGFYHQNIVWISLNIIALFVEMGAKALYTIEGLRKWRENNIGDVAFRRILAALQIIPFAFGLYSNFYFLGGSLVGGAFYDRILIEETLPMRWPAILLLTLGYFNSHTAMEVDRKIEEKRKSIEGKKEEKLKKG